MAGERDLEYLRDMAREDAARLGEEMLEGRSLKRIARLMDMKPAELKGQVKSGELPAWRLFELSYLCAYEIGAEDRLQKLKDFVLED